MVRWLTRTSPGPLGHRPLTMIMCAQTPSRQTSSVVCWFWRSVSPETIRPRAIAPAIGAPNPRVPPGASTVLTACATLPATLTFVV